MWRKLFKTFGAIVVITEDFDGEVRYRFAKLTPFGRLTCKAYLRIVTLNKDGTCSGVSYVKHWMYV